MQMKVEDETTPSRKGRRANVRVSSGGTLQQAFAVPFKSKQNLQRKTGKAKEIRPMQGDVSRSVSVR